MPSDNEKVQAIKWVCAVADAMIDDWQAKGVPRGDDQFGVLAAKVFEQACLRSYEVGLEVDAVDIENTSGEEFEALAKRQVAATVLNAVAGVLQTIALLDLLPSGAYEQWSFTSQSTTTVRPDNLH